MGKQHYKPSVKSLQVQEELGKFLDFCREFGYNFDERNLFNFKSYAWQQYNKFIQGKNAKNMWIEDARRLNRF